MAKKKKTDAKQRASRAKYKCPPELEEMINLVNLIPPDMTLHSLDKLMEKEISLKREESDEPIMGFSDVHFLKDVLHEKYPSVELLSFIEVMVEHTPQEFKDYLEEVSYLTYIKEPEPDKYKFHRMARKLKEFCDLRNSLRQIVDRLERDRERTEAKPLRVLGYFIDWTMYPVTITTTVERDFDGKLRPASGLVRLLGTFDEDRLRRCAICSRIFWAKRKESKTCSRKCLNALNVKRFRTLTNEEKAERKAKREENRQLIKSGKAKPSKRSKNNGTL